MPKNETLEEGLNRSANKRGYSGKERQRYIGGAIRNMEKRGEISPRARPKAATHAPARPKAATHAPARPKAATHAPARPKAATHAPARPKAATKPVAPREPLVLSVKKNGPASATRSYDVYSLYKSGSKEPYNASTYNNRKAAQRAAQFEMDAYNHPRGIHTQRRIKI